MMKNSVFSFQVDSPGSSKKMKYEAMTEQDIVVIEEQDEDDFPIVQAQNDEEYIQ